MKNRIFYSLQVPQKNSYNIDAKKVSRQVFRMNLVIYLPFFSLIFPIEILLIIRES
jgi:hypothetical protein